MSYDIGAELNAVAVTILFANRGLYSVSPPTKERLQALKAWYDRHLDLYLAIDPVEMSRQRPIRDNVVELGAVLEMSVEPDRESRHHC